MGVIIPARVAIIAPGRLFGPYAPLLMFAGGAATERGAELRPLTWPDSELAAAERDGTDPAEWVEGQLGAQLPSAIGPGHVTADHREVAGQLRRAHRSRPRRACRVADAAAARCDGGGRAACRERPVPAHRRNCRPGGMVDARGP